MSVRDRDIPDRRKGGERELRGASRGSVFSALSPSLRRGFARVWGWILQRSEKEELCDLEREYE